MKYLIEEATLTGIADAVREKKGTTDLIQVSNLATEISNIQGRGTVEELTITSNGTYTPTTGIDGFAPVVVNVPQDGAPTAEELTFSGNRSRMFAGGMWDWFINKYGNQIKMQKITNIQYCFEMSSVVRVPFVITGTGATGTAIPMSAMFQSCNGLEEFPDIRDCNVEELDYFLSSCHRLRELPLSFIENNNFDLFLNSTTEYGGNMTSMYSNCYSLRRIPIEWLRIHNPFSATYYSIFYDGFDSCRTLDELEGVPCYEKATWTSNAFSNTFRQCFRLARMNFTTNEDGTPKIVKWKNQTVNLSFYIGYVSNATQITSTNSGITADKEVKDDATYQALKDDPDWFSTDINYSRYNHDSAVNTINSLPDTSAYLASAGGTNTIKFKGASGALTDGGAINTLTEEEIAVATAKGWTVSLV